MSLEKGEKKKMKKISYVFTLIALLLLPNLCFAQSDPTSNIISDIKVENPSTSNEVEGKDKIIVSFKVLKDLDISNKDAFYVYGSLTPVGETGNSSFSVDFYKSTVYEKDDTTNEKIENTGFKLATGDNCTNPTDITDNKIPKNSTVCAIQEVEKGQKLTGELGITVEYQEDHILEEEIKYNVEENKISTIDVYDVTYSNEMMESIEKHYNGYVYGNIGDQYAVGLVFDKTGNGEYTDDSEYVSLGYIYWDSTKDLDYYIKLIDEAIAKAGIKFNTQVENNAMKKDVLGGIKASKQKAEFETKKDDKVLYAWTFDGAAMDGTDFDIDMNLSIGESTNKEKIEKLVKNKKEALVLEFAYHGKLPKGTSVKVNVSDAYKDNDTLSLYYYNEEGKLELVSKGIKVSNGFAEFALEHCSEYVLVKENNSNNAQTSSMNVVFYGILGISSLLGGMYIIKTRKEA